MAYMTANHTGEIPAAQGGAKAKEILERHIAKHQASAVNLMEYLEAHAPKDTIAKGGALSFEPARPAQKDLGQALNAIDATLEATEQARRSGVLLRMGQGEPLSIHRHALDQMAERAALPGKHLREWVDAGGWKAEMAAEVLRRSYSNGEGTSRFLIRSVDRQVRGFLSSKYRRLDSRPLVDAFAQECQKVGAVPVQGEITETRVALKALIPVIYEPMPGEVVTFGVEWGNSDFGHGKHSVRAFLLRVWCLNGATMENALGQVHLGRDLSGDIEVSERTRNLDTQASISALRDVVSGVLAPEKIEKLCASIRAAETKQIDWRHMGSKLARSLFADELKAVRDAYEGEDVYNLPGGRSAWRMSNALSWVAQRVEDPNRRIDLQRLAGQVLHGRSENEVAELDAA